MSKGLNSVELARIEFEKHLEDDPNNEWLKRLIKGLKMAEQSLKRLEQIDNASPSEAMKQVKFFREQNFYDEIGQHYGYIDERCDIIEQALIKAQQSEKIISGIESYINSRISIEPREDVKKAFNEIRQQLQIIKEVVR